jgi:hypothetical protein
VVKARSASANSGEGGSGPSDVDENGGRQRAFAESRAQSASAPSLTAAESAQLEATLKALPNKNRPSDYRWLEGLLGMIAFNAAPVVRDLATQAVGSPLFVMAGACPSVFAGMQAVVFTAMYEPRSPSSVRLSAGGTGAPSKEERPTIDFWWLKPRPEDGNALQEDTLHRVPKGTWKNDPGASKKIYSPLAALFDAGGTSTDGKLRFGVLPRADANLRARAYIECTATRVRYLLCWVWLEDWSSPISLGKKYMKGKLVYQRGDQGVASASTGRYYARPFKFLESLLIVPPGSHLEEEVGGVLPADSLKIGCNV